MHYLTGPERLAPSQPRAASTLSPASGLGRHYVSRCSRAPLFASLIDDKDQHFFVERSGPIPVPPLD